MNRFIAVSILVFLFLFSCKQRHEGYTVLPVGEFAELIESRNIQCLDVRTVIEYSKDHIPGSLNINVRGNDFEAVVDSVLQKDEPVAVYCGNGKRSRKAAEILVAKGYTVYELASGIDAWKEKQMPVIK